MLVKTSFNDSQVMYWEPAKYVARLRALKTDTHPLVFKINMAAGHGGASGRYDRLKEIAFDYASCCGSSASTAAAERQLRAGRDAASTIAALAPRRRLAPDHDAQRPRRLLPDVGVLVLQRRRQAVGGAAVADGAERPGDLFRTAPCVSFSAAMRPSTARRVTDGAQGPGDLLPHAALADP